MESITWPVCTICHKFYENIRKYDEMLTENSKSCMKFSSKLQCQLFFSATEENQDLVALIAKQKDNKGKKRGVSGKGGRRAVTSIGHHHRSGLILRSSPKFSNGMRPTSSTGKANIAKVCYSSFKLISFFFLAVFQCSQLWSSINFCCISSHNFQTRRCSWNVL